MYSILLIWSILYTCSKLCSLFSLLLRILHVDVDAFLVYCNGSFVHEHTALEWQSGDGQMLHSSCRLALTAISLSLAKTSQVALPTSQEHHII